MRYHAADHVEQPVSPDPIDLDAYLRRIGHDGARTPTLDVLRDIVWGHSTTIAFENLNPFLGWEVPLDLPALERKLVAGGRGGYCFEQNGLLRAALEALGFEVTGLAARVLWNAAPDVITPRGHMLLRVDIDEGPHLVDVGFGGQTLTGVLRLDTDDPQETPHERFRVVAHEGGDHLVQAEIGGQWRTTYRFDLQPQHPVDYEVTNYYLSTHPRSHFRTGLVASRPAAGRRHNLRDRRLTIHHLDGPTEHRVIETAADLRRTLEDEFLIDVPDTPDLDSAFDRLP